VLVAQTEKLLELFPDSAVWLVAQSNVAVKNIAEKLLKVKIAEGQWKLLVSSDFHNDWYDPLILILTYHLPLSSKARGAIPQNETHRGNSHLT